MILGVRPTLVRVIAPSSVASAASLAFRASVGAFAGLAVVACGASTPSAGPCPCACPSSSATVAVAGSASVAPLASASASDPLPASATPSGNPDDYSPHELAGEHAETARVKMSARDGAGCLAELDQHDKLDPRHPSTDAKHSHVAYLRAQCLMLAGKCAAGRELLRKLQTVAQGAMNGPEQVEKIVDVMAGMYCEGGEMTPRDRFLRARMDLTTGAWTTKKDVAFCMSAYKTMWSLRAVVKPKDDDDSLVKDPLPFLLTAAPACLAKAGDCAAAFATYKEVSAELYKGAAWSRDEKIVRTSFESSQPRCRI
jgi:hypothetical protein